MVTMRVDPLRLIAEQVADCFANAGSAFVEEEKIDGLAATLGGSYLTVAGIPVDHPDTDDPFSAPLERPPPAGERGEGRRGLLEEHPLFDPEQ